MWKIFRRAAGCAAVLLLTAGMLVFLSGLTERKASREKYADFFSQEQDFDVLFMGSSHVINAVYPMELWNDYGIVSYNFGGHSNQLATTYWVMKNALDYTSPKLMVIDCMGITGERKSSDAFSMLHQSFDAFPLSVTKVRTVWDLLDDSEMDKLIDKGEVRDGDETRTKLGLLWDFSVYHARWNELTQDDFEPAVPPEKGAESRIGVYPTAYERDEQHPQLEGGTVGEEYLRRMIEDCLGKGIDVLLLYLPFPAGSQQQQEAEYAEKLALEYGVNYINFLEEDLVDYGIDYFDADSHVNPSGARKITEYLGRYITEHYEIPDRRSDSAYGFWNEDYGAYMDMKDHNLVQQTSLYNYLMLLAGDDLDVAMDVYDPAVFQDALVQKLMQNLHVDVSQLGPDTDAVLIREGEEQAVVLNNLRDTGSADTPLGTMHVREMGEETYRFFLDGLEMLKGKEGDRGLRITVYRGDRLVDDVLFHYAIHTDGTAENVSAIRETESESDTP